VQPMSRSELMGVRQVAESKGCSTATVKRAALSGELPYELKMPGASGAYLFTREAVEAWRAERAA